MKTAHLCLTALIGLLAATASAQAFGWTGAGGQEAWADPVTGISFASFTNGLDQEFATAHARARELSTIAGGLA